MRAPILVLAGLMAACTPAADEDSVRVAPTHGTPASAAGAETPATPGRSRAPSTAEGVTVSADPAPPFTYWAPPGSVIRNHGNQGLWVAEVNGQPVKTYFGDVCGASGLQDWVGKPADDFPAQTPPVELRVIAQGDAVTQDLRPSRLNVTHDRTTRRIIEVACY